MSLNFTKSPILAVIVVAALAAGTALLAGYAEKPNDAAKLAAADGTCASCPKLETGVCCQGKTDTADCASCPKACCEGKTDCEACALCAKAGGPACCKTAGAAQCDDAVAAQTAKPAGCPFAQEAAQTAPTCGTGTGTCTMGK